MNPEITKFSSADLQKINDADDLKISPLRSDGITYGTPTWIWEVVVDGNLYVRAYNGQNSRWYQSAMKQQAGRIHAAGMVRDVNFEPVGGDINHQIDQAYKQKYSKSPYLAPMVSDKARLATVKILPKQ